jgi:hypothetical protein
MADLKLTELPDLATAVASNDVLVVVDVNNDTTKKITVLDLVGNLPSNTSVTGNFTVSANTSLNVVKVTGPTAVSSNNTTTQFGAAGIGTLAWDANYLYVAVDATTVKRIALSIFDS